tara:strand:- start:7476 stop:7637 length:162 start_codon:yes stop_codon:yes gene_type:complete
MRSLTFTNFKYLGSIPSWLINWALKTGVPKGLDDIRKAVEGYEKYKKKQEKKK